MEVTKMLHDFRVEKEGILEKATKERHKRDDKIRDLQIQSEKQLDDMRSKTTLKRLELEKKHEETQDRLTKEKDKLNVKVTELTEKTTQDTEELEKVIGDKQRLY